MKAYEVIALADELAPNVFSDNVKLFELNRLEQRILVDVLQEDPDEVVPFTAEDLHPPAPGDDTEAAEETEEESEESEESGTLALPERYRDVYVVWMITMYYWNMGEYEEYQNKKAMFDNVWRRFVRDVCDELHKGTGGEEYVRA